MTNVYVDTVDKINKKNKIVVNSCFIMAWSNGLTRFLAFFHSFKTRRLSQTIANETTDKSINAETTCNVVIAVNL